LVYLTLYSFVSDHWPMSASPISSMAFRVRMSLLPYLQFCELWMRYTEVVLRRIQPTTIRWFQNSILLSLRSFSLFLISSQRDRGALCSVDLFPFKRAFPVNIINFVLRDGHQICLLSKLWFK
jgi:hypothetical protein